ncbi:MAG: hypothetical protein ISS35_04775 [Kiritimatiellae bacterium]|nr:hypothetical protein [Kiritimatiellia bacterium]
MSKTGRANRRRDVSRAVVRKWGNRECHRWQDDEDAQPLQGVRSFAIDENGSAPGREPHHATNGDVEI